MAEQDCTTITNAVVDATLYDITQQLHTTAEDEEREPISDSDEMKLGKSGSNYSIKRPELSTSNTSTSKAERDSCSFSPTNQKSTISTSNDTKNEMSQQNLGRNDPNSPALLARNVTDDSVSGKLLVMPNTVSDIVTSISDDQCCSQDCDTLQNEGIINSNNVFVEGMRDNTHDDMQNNVNVDNRHWIGDGFHDTKNGYLQLTANVDCCSKLCETATSDSQYSTSNKSEQLSNTCDAASVIAPPASLHSTASVETSSSCQQADTLAFDSTTRPNKTDNNVFPTISNFICSEDDIANSLAEQLSTREYSSNHENCEVRPAILDTKHGLLPDHSNSETLGNTLRVTKNIDASITNFETENSYTDNTETIQHSEAEPSSIDSGRRRRKSLRLMSRTLDTQNNAVSSDSLSRAKLSTKQDNKAASVATKGDAIYVSDELYITKREMQDGKYIIGKIRLNNNKCLKISCKDDIALFKSCIKQSSRKKEARQVKYATVIAQYREISPRKSPQPAKTRKRRISFSKCPRSKSPTEKRVRRKSATPVVAPNAELATIVDSKEQEKATELTKQTNTNQTNAMHLSSREQRYLARKFK